MSKFHFSEELVNINDVNIEYKLLSDKHYIGKSSFKHFAGFKKYFDEKASLFITFPKMDIQRVLAIQSISYLYSKITWLIN